MHETGGRIGQVIHNPGTGHLAVNVAACASPSSSVLAPAGVHTPSLPPRNPPTPGLLLSGTRQGGFSVTSRAGCKRTCVSVLRISTPEGLVMPLSRCGRGEGRGVGVRVIESAGVSRPALPHVLPCIDRPVRAACCCCCCCLTSVSPSPSLSLTTPLTPFSHSMSLILTPVS
ncbi:hypothetical protein E2C01_032237 [Portunus trituberculatus]|uniref:Uncharacterized protein n=1 Tax=Portunus trituberculatus TaxID=210409 RepID=A0A5B7EZ54_PORTR|nr:hypothetical protein [Portunus trituberculatus]